MSRCRLHVFLPDDREQTGDEKRDHIESEFTERFTLCPDAVVQETSNELVSETFEETDENMERVESFETACREILPDADIIRTRQGRDVMDGKAEELNYETAIMLQVTNALL